MEVEPMCGKRGGHSFVQSQWHSNTKPGQEEMEQKMKLPFKLVGAKVSLHISDEQVKNKHGKVETNQKKVGNKTQPLQETAEICKGWGVSSEKRKLMHIQHIQVAMEMFSKCFFSVDQNATSHDKRMQVGV